MLSGKEKRHLRGLASLVNPVVTVGKEGLSEDILKEIERGLIANELVKIKVGKNAPVDVEDVVNIINENSIGEVVQKIGRNIVLYKKNEKETKISFS